VNKHIILLGFVCKGANVESTTMPAFVGVMSSVSRLPAGSRTANTAYVVKAVQHEQE
jgi:hypothetical protein